MNFVRNARALAVGILPLVVGCVQPVSDASDEDVGVVQQAGGNGTHNGFDSMVANGCWDDILTAMALPLYANGGLNPALPSSVMPDGACAEALQYAVKCTIDETITVPQPEPEEPFAYEGEAIMSTTNGWKTSALTHSQKQDALECMIALVNPNGTVPVCLVGDNVNSGSCLSYQVEEAVWQARASRDRAGNITGVVFDVWILDPGNLCPEGAADDALRARFCTNMDPESCYLNIRTDLATACTENDGVYDCAGPAIKTVLSISDYFSLYPVTCNPPPQ